MRQSLFVAIAGAAAGELHDLTVEARAPSLVV
jgi:hypothetical protein